MAEPSADRSPLLSMQTGCPKIVMMWIPPGHPLSDVPSPTVPLPITGVGEGVGEGTVVAVGIAVGEGRGVAVAVG